METNDQSFAVAAVRRALRGSGATVILRLEIPEIGPTLNQLRSGDWRDSHKHRNRVHNAVDEALEKMGRKHE